MNDPGITDFKIIDDKSGKTVLNKKINDRTTSLGNFQILDFSEINESGTYHIEAGIQVQVHFELNLMCGNKLSGKRLIFSMWNAAAHLFPEYMAPVIATGPVFMVTKG